MRCVSHEWEKKSISGGKLSIGHNQIEYLFAFDRFLIEWAPWRIVCPPYACRMSRRIQKKNAGCSTELIGNNTMTESSMEVNRKRTEKKNEWHCSRLDWMSTIDGGVWSTWPPTTINPLGIQRHCQFRSFLTRITQCHSRIHRVSFVVVIQIINPNPSQWINTTRQTFEFN